MGMSCSGECAERGGGEGFRGRATGAATLAAAGPLAAGIALRVLVALPSHKYAGDADALLAPLRAFAIMRGKLPVFVSEVRLGSLSAWLLAGLFELLGVSRTTLAIEPVLVDSLQLLLWYALWRECLGPRLGLLALGFAAIPPPAFTYWTYMPNTYPETVLLCTATLWLAVRLARRRDRWLSAAGLGLAAGLGFWNSFETLGCTLPALLWLAWRRLPESRVSPPGPSPSTVQDAATRPGRVGAEVPAPPPPPLPAARVLLVMAGTFLLGAFPWIFYNIHHPLGSFHGNFAARPVASVSGLLDNAGYLLTDALPELIASAPKDGPNPAGAVRRFLVAPVLVLALASALFFFLPLAPALLRWLRRGSRSPSLPADRASDPRPELAPLFLMVVLAVCGLYVASEAGAVRGFVVRYVLPLELVMPGMLAYALWRLATVARWRTAGAAAAVLLGAAVITFDLCGTFFPWTEARHRWAHVARADAALIDFLDRQRVSAVVGPYWTAYPVNFLSRERILGLPLEADTDIHHYAGLLPTSAVRWAMVDISRPRLLTCKELIPGRLVDLPLGYHLLLPAESPAPAGFLARVRAACPPWRPVSRH